MRASVERALLTVEPGPAGLRATACFPAELPVFAGHFPRAPLVPGVFLIEVVRCACERCFSRVFLLQEVRDARFTGRLLPGELLEIEVAWRELDGGLRIDSVLRGPGGPVAELRLQLR